MRESILVLALLAASALSGCASEAPVETTANAPGSPPAPTVTDDGMAPANATPAEAAVLAPIPLVLPACEELHAAIRAAASDFEGLPPGWTILVDSQGFATLAFLHQTCHVPGSPIPPNDTVFVFFLLEPPEPLRRDGATHGGLLMAWTSDGGVLAALHALGVASAELHELGIANSDSHQGVSEVRIVQGDPDFVLTLNTAGASSPLPWEDLRLFEFAQAVPVAAFDRLRPEVLGSAGVATASLLLDTRPGDFPDHRVGTGSVMTSADVDVVLASALVGVALV